MSASAASAAAAASAVSPLPAGSLAPSFTPAGFPTAEQFAELADLTQMVLDSPAARALLALAQAHLGAALQTQGLTVTVWSPTSTEGTDNEVRRTFLEVHDVLTAQVAKVTLQLIVDISPRGRTEFWFLVDALSGDSRRQTEQLMACEWAADVPTGDRQFEMNAALVAQREKLGSLVEVAAWLSEIHMP